jgi:hypothetical protein
MFFEESRIYNVSDLLSAVERRRRSKHVPIWYRGSTNRSHTLVPSIGRRPYELTYERALINAFKQNAVQFVDQRPPSEWEWLFLARHHSVPTRLLDWTESPLIGLYFAVHSVDDSTRNARRDGVLWVLLPTALNQYASIILPDDRALPMFEDNDQHLANYLPSKLASEQQTRLTPAAGIAIRHSKRMQAQHSVFTVTHRDQTPVENIGKGAHIGRYIIPAGAKGRIRNQLDALKIDRLSVFPELDNAARAARRPYDE